MEIQVKLNNIRIAPRKSRQVADLIRGKSALEAMALLEFTVKKASDPLLKLIKSGIDSALRNHQSKEGSLRIFKITVDGGPILKRMFPMSRGRGYPIMKRTSHITLVLSDDNDNLTAKKQSNSKLKNKK
jgi:large subunit ribosomal protein L22